MQKIKAIDFYKLWVAEVDKRKEHLLSIWRNNKEYTRYIKGHENGVVEEIAKNLNLLCYSKDYYSIDTIFYKHEDLVPDVNEGTFWF